MTETARASVSNVINNMFFGVFYRPPSSDVSYIEQLENAIQQVSLQNIRITQT